MTPFNSNLYRAFKVFGQLNRAFLDKTRYLEIQTVNRIRIEMKQTTLWYVYLKNTSMKYYKQGNIFSCYFQRLQKTCPKFSLLSLCHTLRKHHKKAEPETHHTFLHSTRRELESKKSQIVNMLFAHLRTAA